MADGTQKWPNDAGYLVHMELAVLGEPASSGCGTGGGAECGAVPYAYGSKGGEESGRVLADVGFSATAQIASEGNRPRRSQGSRRRQELRRSPLRKPIAERVSSVHPYKAAVSQRARPNG